MDEASGWRVAAQQRDRVGEGPVWIANERALYWVDVLGPAVNRLSLADGSLRRWAMPEPIGFLVPRREKPGFIAGLKSGFYSIELDPLVLELIGDPEPHLPEHRFNDGKADAAGRLWAGTMPMDGAASDGVLYRLDADRSWHTLDTGYRVANGPAFSPEHDHLYHADSPRGIIYQFDLDDQGGLHDKRLFIRFADGWGLPDGMTVDAEGHLWVAHWDGGRVSRFDPDGRLDRSLRLPASRVTSCAFAGPALDRLYVTTAREEREDEPLAGALFEFAPGVTGLPTGAFAG